MEFISLMLVEGAKQAGKEQLRVRVSSIHLSRSNFRLLEFKPRILKLFST